MDYFVTDSEIFSIVDIFKVHDSLDTISDHCPISAVINFDLLRNVSQQERNRKLECAPNKIKWNETIRQIFIHKIGNDECREKIENVNRLNMNDGSQIEKRSIRNQ